MTVHVTFKILKFLEYVYTRFRNSDETVFFKKKVRIYEN